MFGDIEAPLDAGERAKRDARQRSVLDFVIGDARRLKNSLGPTDQQKLDEYLTSVRDVEKRIAASGERDDGPVPDMARPLGIPANYADHARLMFDLMALAFQTNMTRVATFMMGREGSNLTYPDIEVKRAHHGG